jgi:hypothetical protein
MRCAYFLAALVWWLRPWLIVASVATLIACTTQDALVRKAAELSLTNPEYDDGLMQVADVANRRFITNDEDEPASVKSSVIASSALTSPTGATTP